MVGDGWKCLSSLYSSCCFHQWLFRLWIWHIFPTSLASRLLFHVLGADEVFQPQFWHIPATNAVETAHYFKLRQAEHLQVFDVHHVLRKGSAFSSRFQQGKRHVYTSLTSWILTLPWNHVGTHFNSTTNLLLCVQSKIWLPMTDLHFAWNPCTSKCLLNVPNHPGKVLRLQLINITSDQTCLKVINIIL